MSDTTIITVRLPQSFVDRADALIDNLAKEEESLLLGRVSRSIVLRLAVLRGLEALEAQVARRAGSAEPKSPVAKPPPRKRAAR
jgi:hypothetical protein